MRDPLFFAIEDLVSLMHLSSHDSGMSVRIAIIDRLRRVQNQREQMPSAFAAVKAKNDKSRQ